MKKEKERLKKKREKEKTRECLRSIAFHCVK